MKARMLFLAALAVFGFGGALAAQENQTEAPPTVFVPYDRLDRVIADPKPRVYLPMEEYKKLQRAASGPSTRPAGEAVVSEAVFKGRVEGEVARMTLELKVRAIGTPPMRARLPLEGLSVAQVSSAEEGAVAGPASDGIELIFTRAGDFHITAEVVAKVIKEAARASVSFEAPPAAVTQLEILLPEKGISPAITPEVGFFVEENESGTRIRATLGAARKVRLDWRPRVEKLTELPPALFLSSFSMLSVEETLIKLDTLVRVRIAHAPVGEFEFKIPDGYTAVNVEGEALREWTVADGKLHAALFSPAANSYDLRVELQRVRAREETTMALPALKLPAARSEQGFVGVRYPPTMTVRLQALKGVAEIEPGDLPATAPLKREESRLAARFLQSDFEGTLAVSPLEPQVRVSTLLYEDVQLDGIECRAHMALEVRQAGILRVQLTVPAEAQEVNAAGDAIADFSVRDAEKAKQVTVDFKRRILGETAFTLRFKLPAPLDEIAVAQIAVEGARHHEGWVGIRLNEVLLPAVTDMRALMSADLNEALAAFKPLLAEAKALSLALRYVEAPYGAVIRLKRQKPTVNAVVQMLAAVKTDHVSYTSTVSYEIRYAAVETARVSLPAEVASQAVIEGKGIKEKRLLAAANGRATWEIDFQWPMRNAYELTVKLEKPLTWEGNSVKLAVPDLAAEGVERETGFIGVSRDPSLAVVARETENVEPIDARDLPPAMQREDVFLSYRFFRHPVTLGLETEKGKPATVVGTLINYEVVVASLAADKSCTTDVVWRLQNNARQELDVALPEKAKILLVEVKGAAMSPRRRPRDGKLVIPIPRTQGNEAALVHLA